MAKKSSAEDIARAREVMQHMISTNSPNRERQERLINQLKAKATR